MTKFNLYVPILVRYGDLDPQWHVNNSRFVTFIEQARFEYLLKADLWDGEDFFNLGLIVADQHIAYIGQIFMTQKIHVGVGVTRIGNKSLTFEYTIEDQDTGQALAKAETIMVAYDYHNHTSIPVSAEWRQKISSFEGIPF
ncbi:MAG TPA: thioesterase family protein [Anaerolineaceae bacterium]|nr:thioesterase family protein [Anaerolineaceae bacterium]